MAVDIQRVHRTFMDLKERRQPWDSLWADTARYYLPTSMQWASDGKNRNQPTIRGRIVYDDTPAWAAEQFASSLLGMIVNPAQKWLEFELYTDQEDLSDESKVWLGKLRDIVLAVLQAPDVGFYDAMHEHLLDYGIFGEAVMLIDKNPDTGLPRFTPYPLEQCYIGLGASKKPDTVFRQFTMTCQQMIDFFGLEACPEKAITAYEAGRYQTEFTIIHGVFPRKHGVAGGFANNKPWASIYYVEDNKHVLRESGFDHFPFSAPRYIMFASEEHGQGPGTLSLSNCKTLQAIVKTTLVSDQRVVSPPYLSQRRGWIKPLNLTPNAINYYDGFDIDKALIPIANNGQPQAGREWIELYQNQITRAFHLDKLFAPEKKAEVKEVEVLVNEDERMRGMVPQLSRLHSESIVHIITNVVSIIINQLPPPPPELGQKFMKIRYLSPLARAQQMLEVGQANRTIQQILIPAAQIDPSLTGVVDWYNFIGWAFERSGFPASVMKNKAQYQAEQQQAAQQQQAAMSLEAGQGMSEIAKNFSQAQANQPPVLGGFF